MGTFGILNTRAETVRQVREGVHAAVDSADVQGVRELFERLGIGHCPVEAALPAIYEELRRIAADRLGALPPGQTLQATAIVNELIARGFADEPERWESRAHFFGAAAIAVRNLLVEHARRRSAAERARAEHARMVPAQAEGLTESDDELLALDAALERLRSTDERKFQVVSLRFFVGRTIEETAQLLNLSTATVERDWAYARAWLQREMRRMMGDLG